MRKFLDIIYRGLVNMADRTSRRFISLLVPDPELKRKIQKLRRDPEAVGEAYKAVQCVVETAAQAYDIEDMKQDMKLIILKLMKSYRPIPGKHFSGYLAKAFPYKVIDIIRGAGGAIETWFKDERVMYSEVKSNEYPEPFAGRVPDVFEQADRDAEYALGPQWVSGADCDERFSKLTSLERNILKLYYMDGYSDSEISKVLGISRSRISQKRKEAVEKLKLQL